MAGDASDPWGTNRLLLTGLCALGTGLGVFLAVWFLVYGLDLGPVLRADAGIFLRDYVLRFVARSWDADRDALLRSGVLAWFDLTLWIASLPALLGSLAAGGFAWRAFEPDPHYRGARLVSRPGSKNGWWRRKKPRTSGPTDRPGTPGAPAPAGNPGGKDSPPSPGSFEIAGVATTPDLPCSHILIGATTGAGKSNVLQSGVLDRILDGCDRRPGREKALVVDAGGEFLRTRGHERDLILNPFDRRSRHWNPFSEIRQESDFDLVANAVLPDAPSASQPEWIGMGRDFLVDVMKAQRGGGNASPAETFRLVVNAEIEELGEILAGTTSEVLIKSTANERLLANIRYEASRAMRSWQLLDPEGDFSLRAWIREGSGILFLTTRPSEWDTLKTLVGAWLSLALRETLSLPADPDRRVWVVADELDSLGRVNALDAALSMGRKNGLATIATVQSVAQLERTYGHDTARVLLSVFASKLVLRPGAAYDAEHWSRELGEREEWRTGHSQNTGASGESAGTNDALHNVRLVLPSELMDLPKFSGYMRLADRPGITKFAVPFRAMEDRFPAFVPVDAGEARPKGTEVEKEGRTTPEDLAPSGKP